MTTYLQSLREGLEKSFAQNEFVCLLGEDVLDPYGGAFKVTLGLATAFPERVFGMPISEAGFTGMAVGMAVRGLRPVVEIMFGDFITLCSDQIINHMTKFALMYPGVTVPIVIRTPMGGGRGYGATHSQSIEKMFFGVPGLTVVSPSLAHNAGSLLRRAILDDDGPVLFVENKMLYGQSLIDSACHLNSGSHSMNNESGYSTAVVCNRAGVSPDIAILAYGGASRVVLSVMARLVEEEISIKGIFPSQISPIPIESLMSDLQGIQKILIVEEGCEGFNWGSEVAATLFERLTTGKRPVVRRLAAKSMVIPCCEQLEADVLITDHKVEQAVMEMLE